MIDVQATHTGTQAPSAQSLYAMADPLAARLARFGPLSVEDRAALSRLAEREAGIGVRTDLARDGEAVEFAFLVLEGIACRYVQTASGARQILALLLPGDLCDLDLLYFQHWDHAVATLSPCRIARIGRNTLKDLILARPNVALALRRAKLEAEVRSRSWLTMLGVCLAEERLARLFWEVIDRQREIGLAHRNECRLPLTQGDLAECIGVSTIHINRTLSEMRRTGLLDLRRKHLLINDEAGLSALLNR